MPGPRHILEIAERLGLPPDQVIPYGRGKAKISLDVLSRLPADRRGRYILLTAINPTPLGEGKTTTAIGLAMALSRLGRSAAVTLRQPSLGPVFGVKGGGAGGGRSHLVPLDEVNLHLTGDAHAVTSSHNLLSAFIDNHLFHGNARGLNPKRILWPRAMNVNDRALRRVYTGASSRTPGRWGRFVLTEASEVMAILALASGYDDLRRRLGRILVGLGHDDGPLTAEDLACAGAMAVLLREALQPNLVQTVEGTPVLVHAGPFGNIAHGNCSVLADAVALRCADYVLTEAGFASELGAEKFFNIKCRMSGERPDAAVVVATLRALKLHGGGPAMRPGAPVPAGLRERNPDALRKGLANLEQHLANVAAHGIPAVVAINAFEEDTEDELRLVAEHAREAGATAAAVTTHFVDGGAGAERLAEAVIAASERPARFRCLYEPTWPVEDKIDRIATRMYGASGVRYADEARAGIDLARRLGLADLPVCMAKTPVSLSHDPSLIGRPTGFVVPVKDVRVSAGAGFLVALCSGIQLMPGLPRRPAAEHVDLDTETGDVKGLT